MSRADCCREVGLAPETLLERTRSVANEVLAHRASEADLGESLPDGNLAALARAGLLGITTPVEYGGHAAPGRVVRECIALLASACGATNFVQIQHVFGCAVLAGGQGEAVKRDLLPRFASGERLLSLAYSHVRRPGPPAVRAEETAQGWTFHGVAPWMTGEGMADEVLLGGTLPDGRLVFALAPLEYGPRLQASPPARLVAFTSTRTVALRLDGLFVPAERWVRTITQDEMAAADTAGGLNWTALSVGAALASITMLRELAAARHSDLIERTASALDGELAELREEIETWAGRVGQPEHPERAVGLRARSIALGVRSAHAAVTASAGSASSLTHSAQRLFREAMVYTLNAQTRPVQAATLELLTRH